jgi:hypothetical protein
MPLIAGIIVRTSRKLSWRRALRAWRFSAPAMSRTPLLWLLGMITLASGCTVCRQTRRTLCQEPSRFSELLDRKRSIHTYRCWAKQAWLEERKSSPDLPVSEAYELGFSDGFTNYVYAGGTGEPPPVPPREFWNVCERSPDGKAAAAEWLAGYRHGSRVARAGGYRERGVVLTSLIPFDDQPGPGGMPMMAPDGSGLMAPPTFEGEVLGPAIEDSASVPTTEGADGPESEARPTMPVGDASSESSGELPAPPSPKADQTTQASASAFKSVLLNAAGRHQATPSSTPESGGAVKPTAASKPVPPESSESSQRSSATLHVVESAE